MSAPKHLDDIINIISHNTDTIGSWKQKGPYNNTYKFEEMLNLTVSYNANILVQTSTNTWYIKNIGLTKTNQEITEHIENNKKNNYKPKSKVWIIEYNIKSHLEKTKIVPPISTCVPISTDTSITINTTYIPLISPPQYTETCLIEDNSHKSISTIKTVDYIIHI